MKAKIITLGCSKNTVDSEFISGELISKGIEIFKETEQNIVPDLIIINTCGFIDKAKEESINTILEAINFKASNNNIKVIAYGCLAQRYRDELKKEIPELDAIFGVSELKNLIDFITNHKSNKLANKRNLITPSHFAYLKVSEGCNHRCSFCSIPIIRGKYRSKSIEELIIEAIQLRKFGVKELILIAQDLTYYGKDLYKKYALIKLLENIIDKVGFEWLRLHYAYPPLLSNELLSFINQHPTICKYIDIPFQHISTRILQEMKRSSTKQDIYTLIDKIRNTIPGVAIRTSFIIGYPSETKKEFEELKAFIQEMQFERLGVFTYSHEENTQAFSNKDNVSEKVKLQRMEEIMMLQHDISLKQNVQKISSVQKVLIDKLKNEQYFGRTQYDSPDIDNEVIISKNSNIINIGTFADIKIIQADAYDLHGETI